MCYNYLSKQEVKSSRDMSQTTRLPFHISIKKRNYSLRKIINKVMEWLKVPTHYQLFLVILKDKKKKKRWSIGWLFRKYDSIFNARENYIYNVIYMYVQKREIFLKDEKFFQCPTSLCLESL